MMATKEKCAGHGLTEEQLYALNLDLKLVALARAKGKIDIALSCSRFGRGAACPHGRGQAHQTLVLQDHRQCCLDLGGLCAWPECSRAAEHLHHLEYSVRGGSDEPTNLCALCSAHHLRGVHFGYLFVRGRAGELLVFKASDNGEVWHLVGEDEVRREDELRRAGDG